MFEAKVNGTQVYEVALKGKGYTLDGVAVPADVQRLNDHAYQVLYQGASHTVHIVSLDRAAKTVVLKIDGKRAEVVLSNEMDRLLKKLGLENAGATKVSDIKAPMPGLIHSIKVTEGQSVSKGDPILILEAMKMENVIKSPTDGTIGKILVVQGHSVDKGAVMITMK
jgi:biotin carboxyl carrier protein